MSRYDMALDGLVLVLDMHRHWENACQTARPNFNHLMSWVLEKGLPDVAMTMV